MTVRFEKTAGGEVAIMPREEYEALIARLEEAEEDEGTARLVERAMAEGGPSVPMEFVSRLAEGENAIRVLREWRSVTQVDLASRTRLSQGYISDIETGRRTGTPTALQRIADALEVPLDLLA